MTEYKTISISNYLNQCTSPNQSKRKYEIQNQSVLKQAIRDFNKTPFVIKNKGVSFYCQYMCILDQYQRFFYFAELIFDLGVPALV
jgi:hypothetical protein